MKCHIYGFDIHSIGTDLHFKRDNRCIVTFRDPPVQQCENCGEYFLGDAVMEWVEASIVSVSGQGESFGQA
ncbi:MAG: YgiT-type zinc finger protein [Proteobacteria bacterium]|nr:YgiT-type zinc finger protein [Pseudomonadota bacterium]